MAGTLALTRAELMRLTRNRRYLIFTVALPVVFYLLIGKQVKAERKARMGRNPQTGEAIKIKAKTVVKFRVAKVAKDAIAPPKK